MLTFLCRATMEHMLKISFLPCELLSCIVKLCTRAIVIAALTGYFNKVYRISAYMHYDFQIPKTSIITSYQR